MKSLESPTAPPRPFLATRFPLAWCSIVLAALIVSGCPDDWECTEPTGSWTFYYDEDPSGTCGDFETETVTFGQGSTPGDTSPGRQCIEPIVSGDICSGDGAMVSTDCDVNAPGGWVNVQQTFTLRRDSDTTMSGRMSVSILDPITGLYLCRSSYEIDGEKF